MINQSASVEINNVAGYNQAPGFTSNIYAYAQKVAGPVHGCDEVSYIHIADMRCRAVEMKGKTKLRAISMTIIGCVAKQEIGVRALTADNAQTLQRGGVQPTPDALTAAHRFGAQGALQLASVSPNTPLGAVLPAAAAANPQWAHRSAGELLGGRRQPTESPAMDQPAISQQSLDAGRAVAFGGLNPNLRDMIGTMLLSRSMHGEGLRLAEHVIGGQGQSPLDEFAKRAQVGQQYGLQPGSDAHREYVLTGRLPQPKAPESPFSKIHPKDYTSE